MSLSDTVKDILFTKLKRMGFTQAQGELIFCAKDGEVVYNQLLTYQNSREKHECYAGIPKIAEEVNADMVIMATEAWMVMAKKGNLKNIEGIRPSEHPDKQEVFIVVGINKDGDTCMVNVPIYRTKKGFKTGKMQEINTNGCDDMSMSSTAFEGLKWWGKGVK